MRRYNKIRGLCWLVYVVIPSGLGATLRTPVGFYHTGMIHMSVCVGARQPGGVGHG